MGLVGDISQFDLIVLALLVVSGAVGFTRGAVREIVALAALFVAAGIAVLGLPVFGPMVRKAIHPDWLGTGVALVIVFIVAFIALRLIGAGIARSVQSTQMLGFLDRSLGLLIGLGRGFVVLGGLYLMFMAATPEDLRPNWITGARTWPVAANMGRLLQRFVPQGLTAAGQLKPAFDRAISDGSGDRSTTEGYEARQQPDADAPERTR